MRVMEAGGRPAMARTAASTGPRRGSERDMALLLSGRVRVTIVGGRGSRNLPGTFRRGRPPGRAALAVPRGALLGIPGAAPPLERAHQVDQRDPPGGRRRAALPRLAGD